MADSKDAALTAAAPKTAARRDGARGADSAPAWAVARTAARRVGRAATCEKERGTAVRERVDRERETHLTARAR